MATRLPAGDRRRRAKTRTHPHPSPTPPQAQTYVSANVDEQRYVRVRVIHQVGAAELDQGAQVVLLELAIKCIAGHLGERRASGFHTHLPTGLHTPCLRSHTLLGPHQD